MTVPAADNLRLCAEAAAELDRPRMAEVITRHADLLDAIAALHQPIDATYLYRHDGKQYHADLVTVCSCGQTNCPTARLLQGEGE